MRRRRSSSKRSSADLVTSLGSYPTTLGVPQLRAAIARWLTRRFALPAGSIDPETMILPVNGTREALFAFVQCMTDPRGDACVVMPNPFYQIYEGAALLAGAEPYYMGNDCEQRGPARPRQRSRRGLAALPACCSCARRAIPPAPSRASSICVMRCELADRYDFVVASDECYSEIYLDESRPPPGLLQAAHAAGHSAYRTLHRVPQPLEALQRARTALRVRRRRSDV